MELSREKRVVRTVKHSVKVNVWSCFSSKSFGRIICFRQNLDAKFMCNIYRYGLLPTAQKQFGHYPTLWKLQEDNDPKYMSKLASHRRQEKGIGKIGWASMSPDLAPIENIRQLLKMTLTSKKLTTYQSLVSAIKHEWKALPRELALRLVHWTENQIFGVIKSHGDFILH